MKHTTDASATHAGIAEVLQSRVLSGTSKYPNLLNFSQ